MTHLSSPVPRPLRRLCLVLGDQLNGDSAVFDGFDPAQDAVLMCEARGETRRSGDGRQAHKRRLAFFFSAMRHFAADQAALGHAVLYHRLDDPEAPETLAAALSAAIAGHAPLEIRLAPPGDRRVAAELEAAAGAAGRRLEVVEERHFMADLAAIEAAAASRKRYILEDFYREMRRRTGWLMESSGAPEGGAWNFDKENRKSFGRAGPGLVPPRESFAPDAITREVLKMVEARFPEAPGSLARFDEPVTAADAARALEDFINHRLARFGEYQDAMAGGRRTLYHARISAAMNVKLLDPRQACLSALAAYADGRAPVAAVEGFVRQILGWREFVRWVYWREGPDYGARNALEADLAVPDFFWTGETEMACLRDALGGVVATAYAHHIERLMVMGLFMLLMGAHPARAQDWHMGMYLDAIDWVSLPNVLGMSQHADGGVVGTKPYCASGAYIDRMSDHCRACRYDPKQSTGAAACPFTTLYWDFLARHETRFSANRRMAMQMRNLARKEAGEMSEIRRAADRLKTMLS